MTKELEILLRNVFSVDTEAGYKLRYHITRALACKEYALDIVFNPFPDETNIVNAFIWFCTSEGGQYWVAINKLLQERSR
jgi:hypothetical protein